MRIGINGSSHIALGSPYSAISDHVKEAEADGFHSYWLAQLAAPDALTTIGALGAVTSRIELGTAVVPTWIRHPAMLAAQALTVSELTDNRVVVGIGLAHKEPVEARFEIAFDRPAANMADYLAVLMPLLTERTVDYSGDAWSAHFEPVGGVPGAGVPSVMLAAMGPRMLALAGSQTDGTILWLSGPRTIEERIKPAVDAAAAEAGRATPRIVASVPVCVTDDPDSVREMVAAMLANYNDLPSYRSVMDTEGVDGPAGVALIGDEATVTAGLDRFAAVGVTDFSALEFTLDDTAAARTRALLKERNS